jgi:DNA mismatch repair protein MutL
MGVIAVLPSDVADQIAAGEVVERPASVCKELVENALDAGATRVDVDVVGGGLERLVVQDDGCGMDDDDAVLCFSRHATSKIRSAHELLDLHSFGFRGEALAAISSVSRVNLTTRREGRDSGFRVAVDAGRIASVGEAGALKGTRVDVADLFFNVPARRKFLKTMRTEAGHIEDALLSVALCKPGVALRLTVDGKVVLDLPAVAAAHTDTLEHPARVDRVVRCLGNHLRPHLYPVRGQTELLTVSGYVVAPVETRRDLAGVHLSVNGRPVADRQLVQAVRAAFRTLLEVGRQPIVALDLQIDPATVDVNVHPRKAEVRFADPRRVSGHLISLLSEFLSTTPWLDRGRTQPTVFRLHQQASAFSKTSDTVDAGGAVDAGESVDVGKTGDAGKTGDVGDAHRDRIRAALARFNQSHSPAPTTTVRSSFPSPSSSTPLTLEQAARQASPSLPTLASVPGRGGATSFAALRAVGQVGGTYLILEGPDGMVVIDQHAAHERVVFERLRARRQSGQPQPSQPLLLPLTIELSATERAALDDDDVRAELNNFGLDVDGFAHTTALVRALPPGLDGRKAQAIVRDVLAELQSAGTRHTLDERTDAVCARLACHAAIRAGDTMAPVQVRALLDDLDKIDLGAHCPHGRPVVRTLDYTELADWFDR